MPLLIIPLLLIPVSVCGVRGIPDGSAVLSGREVSARRLRLTSEASAVSAAPQKENRDRRPSQPIVARVASRVATSRKSIVQTQRIPLARALADRALWGRDFPTALAFLRSWGQIGERRVYFSGNRVVGATPYKTREEATQAAARLTAATRAPRPRAKPAFAELLRAVPAEAPGQLRVEVISFLPDDDGFHVAWVDPSLQLLAPRLTVEGVRRRLSSPERVVQELIQNDTERRPVVLTLHSYFGGAIGFAESDWSTPGSIDRVIFDVPTVTAALF